MVTAGTLSGLGSSDRINKPSRTSTNQFHFVYINAHCVSLISTLSQAFASRCRLKFLKYELLNSLRSCIQHSPLLPSFFPKRRFHFHISTRSAGSLRVLMQQAEGSEAILWSRSDSTLSNWTPENLPIGLHQQPYRVCV